MPTSRVASSSQQRKPPGVQRGAAAACLVQAVRGEGVGGAQQAVEVVRPEVVADEGEDGDPQVGLDPEALGQRLATLRGGLQQRRQQHAGQRGNQAQRVVAPRAESLRGRGRAQGGLSAGSPGAGTGAAKEVLSRCR